jgi:predicted phage terminase large subunit-like protein
MSRKRGGLRQEDHDPEHLRKVLEAAKRNELASFIQAAFGIVNPGGLYKHNFHIEAIAHRLEQCARGEINRLIITVPPRHLKSLCVSVAYPAFLLGHDPTRRIIAASYSSELADNLARQFRSVVGSREFRRLFPGLRVKRNTEIEFLTSQGGFRYATSVGGTLTGIGGTDIIIDDPLKPEEAMSKVAREAVISWFKTTLSTRLDDKQTGIIILVMQRLHVDDLVGHILQEDPHHWVHLDLPGIAEEPQEVALGNGRVYKRAVGEVLHAEREPLELLLHQKATMGSAAFAAQYQQRPVPAEGNLIKAQWLRNYDLLSEKQPLDKIVQSWDCAAKSGELNDYSVCLTFLVRKNEFYLVDVLRQRLSYPELKKKVLEQKTRLKADVVLIEDTGHGTALIQDLRVNGLHAIGRRPEKDKITRMSAQSAKIEAGQLLLPTRASWLEDFTAEILAFPAGRHDDQVDALSQFLAWADERRVESWPMPIVISRPREIPFESLYRRFSWDGGY